MRYDGVCCVEKNFRTYFSLLLNKVGSLFKWSGLPDSVDEHFLNYTLLLEGKVCFTQFDGKLYACGGNWGGKPNAYYEPTLFTIANPVLGEKQAIIRQLDGTDRLDGLTGIVMANSDADLGVWGTTDSHGLYGLLYQTAGLLADNISSINISQINSRASLFFTAESQAQANSGEKVLQDIYSGKPYKILQQNMVEKFGITPVAQAGSNNIMTLIDAHQYILAQFFNELGITQNWNQKRERLNTAEVEMNQGALDINIWNMLNSRKKALEKINKLFGTNISVELNEEVFWAGSGNATLGEEAEQDNEKDETTPPANEEENEEENSTEVKEDA